MGIDFSAPFPSKLKLKAADDNIVIRAIRTKSYQCRGGYEGMGSKRVENVILSSFRFQTVHSQCFHLSHFVNYAVYEILQSYTINLRLRMSRIVFRTEFYM